LGLSAGKDIPVPEADAETLKKATHPGDCFKIHLDAKAPSGSSGIFFDRSRHVETVVLLERKG
jgi:hypothetical protein